MAPYDDWNRVDDEEDEELQDTSFLESKKDVILFCIDCSPSMQELYEDPVYEGVQTCHLFAALDAAVQIQKKKIITGPNDSVGILLFNTTRRSDAPRGQGSEIKRGTFLFQPISPLGAPMIQELIILLESARENPEELRNTAPPTEDKRVAMGDVFTSCNWVMRDGSVFAIFRLGCNQADEPSAPKTASKRVFLITDEDNPHAGPGSKQLVTSARTTLTDLTQAGVTVEPFFISTEDKPFDVSKFYSLVLQPTSLAEDEDDIDNPSVLPESISISRIEDLLAQMRFHEVPKRAQFSIPFELGKNFTIGVKGYLLALHEACPGSSQQSSPDLGTYKYFVDLGDRMEVAVVKTKQVDEDREAEVTKTEMVYGMGLGVPSGGKGGDEDEEEDDSLAATRTVETGKRPFYTTEEVRNFRTLGMNPVIKLLGFKDRSELAFEDNIKHSVFIYPDEMVRKHEIIAKLKDTSRVDVAAFQAYSGSKRTFSALLKSMVKKDKIGLVLALTRRNSSPTFCALLAQEEKIEEGGWTEPAGFHLIPLPFADDIRSAPIDKGEMALAFHNAQLQATAFNEQFDPESFEDLTIPKYEMVHKRAGKLMKEWKDALMDDPSASKVVTVTGSKRKADTSVDEAEIRSKHEAGQISKLRVDQLKEFLKSKGQSTQGLKADLVERASEWLDAH
ncbi:ATP-dependent DNA helicase II subunit 1 [Marasmius tenuissimus]|uniref:ATP-dependent DNA helicase II subunit 1 n=1 Tax=Marasmius tenuissimus TaxID=585030 RepID=A0ABR2ZUI6_9AGAR